MNQTARLVWHQDRRYRRTVRNVKQERLGMTGQVTIGGKRYLARKGNQSYCPLILKTLNLIVKEYEEER